MKFTANKYLHFALLIIAIYFVVFAKLGSFPIRFWDESIFAVNAFEMIENGNYFVPYFNGEIDVYNTKPLLMVWLQVISIKTIGYNELAIRLPSAIACFFTVLFLFNFLRKEFNLKFAWIASLVLLTSVGYINFHTGRTGDSDAVLTLFITLTAIAVYKWSISKNKQQLLYAVLFLSLGFLAKSFIALIFVLPFLIFVYYIDKKAMFEFIKSKRMIIAIFSFCFVVFIGFGLREIYQPGFLRDTFIFDAGKLFNNYSGSKYSVTFYIDNLFYERFIYWGPLLILGFFLFFIEESKKRKMIFLGSVLFSGIYLIVISLSATKLIWYDMPLYPFFAVITALSIYRISKLLTEKVNLKVLTPIFFVFIFFIPYQTAFTSTQRNWINKGDQAIERNHFYLYDKLRENKMENLTVYHSGFQGPLICYKYMYKDRGFDLRLTKEATFKKNESVLILNNNYKTKLNNNYKYDTVEIYHNLLLTKIK